MRLKYFQFQFCYVRMNDNHAGGDRYFDCLSDSLTVNIDDLADAEELEKNRSRLFYSTATNRFFCNQ